MALRVLKYTKLYYIVTNPVHSHVVNGKQLSVLKILKQM